MNLPCRTKRGLAEHENYHEFCRLLGRLKTNYQLSELVSRFPVISSLSLLRACAFAFVCNNLCPVSPLLFNIVCNNFCVQYCLRKKPSPWLTLSFILSHTLIITYKNSKNCKAAKIHALVMCG